MSQQSCLQYANKIATSMHGNRNAGMKAMGGLRKPGKFIIILKVKKKLTTPVKTE